MNNIIKIFFIVLMLSASVFAQNRFWGNLKDKTTAQDSLEIDSLFTRTDFVDSIGSDPAWIIGNTTESINSGIHWITTDSARSLLSVDSTNLANYVDKTSAQTISGIKTFTGDSTVMNGDFVVNLLGDNNLLTNGDFNTDLTGWDILGGTVEWVASGGGFTGAAHCVLNANGQGVYQAFDAPQNITLRIDINIISNTGYFALQYYDVSSAFVSRLFYGTGVINLDTTINSYSNQEFYIVQLTGASEFYIDNIFFGTTTSTQIFEVKDDTITVQEDLYFNNTKTNLDSLQNYKLGLDTWTSGLSSSSNLLKLGKTGREFYFNDGAYTDFWLGGFVTVPYNLSASINIAFEYRTDYNNDTLKPFVNYYNLIYLDGIGTPIWHPTDKFGFAGATYNYGIGDLPDSVGLDWNWNDWVVGGHAQFGDEVNKSAGEDRFPMPLIGWRFRFGSESAMTYTYPYVYGFYSDFTSFGDQARIEQGYHFYGKGDFPSYFGGDIQIPIGDLILSNGTITVSNLELQRLDGVTGDIQSQFDLKQDIIPNLADTSKYLEQSDSTIYATQDDIHLFITGTPITYPDNHTIAFGGDAIVLDQTTLQLNGSNQITVVGGAGGEIQDTVLYHGRNVPVDSLVLLADIAGDTSNYTVAEMDSLLALAGKSIDTLTYHWGVMDTITVGDLIAYKVESNITIIQVSAYGTTDSITFNIQERSAPNTAGDSLFASPMTAPIAGRDSTSFTGSGGANFTKNNWIMPVVSNGRDATRFGITVWAIKQSY